jgi:hypothetical protein
VTAERAGLTVLLLVGCRGTLVPLRGLADAGRDPIVVFVGGAGDAGGDLYAARTGGGDVVQLTYSPVGEMRPALAPDGGAVAFLRGGSLTDSTPRSVWVMNLLNGAEREVALPRGAAAPSSVGWSQDGRWLVLATGPARYRAPAPPMTGGAEPVPDADRAAADSSLAVLLGEPVFARAAPCAEPENLCVVGNSGAPALLAAGARDAVRWGPDSVGYVVNGGLVVRPVGPGRERRVTLNRAPPKVRQPSMFPGR